MSDVGPRARRGEPSPPVRTPPAAPSPWSFVVSIGSLGSQGPVGHGFLLNAAAVLASTATVSRSIPFLAVDGPALADGAQASLEKLVPVGAGEELAVLRLVDPAVGAPVPGFTRLGPGDRCDLPTGADDGWFTSIGGVAEQSADAFVIRLDPAPRGALGVASGCPVLVKGRVAGIVLRIDPDGRAVVVPLSDVADELADLAPEVRDAVGSGGPSPRFDEVQQQVAQPPSTPDTPPWSDGGEAVLRWAAAVADGRSAATIEPVDVLLGAMVDAQHRTSDNSTNALYECVPDTPPRGQRLDAALAALGVSATPPEPSAAPADVLGDRADALIGRASALASVTTGPPQVRRRHLAAVAVAGDPLPPAVAAALGIDAAVLRQGLRSYVARKWPNEPSGEWEGALAEPDVDLVHRFDGDQVLTWARRHATDGRRADRELTDDLNVRVYATMLATLIARRSTSNSLSIGLFGEWGSGKSTFMELIQQEVEDLTARARASPDDGGRRYFTDIVPIWFNAWHYADANLWASLASELFDQLLGPRPDLDEERRKQLSTELEQGQRRAEELRSATSAAEERAGHLRTELAEAERRREASRGRLDAEILRRVVKDDTVRTELEEAARRAGLDEKQLGGIAVLAREVAGTADEVQAIGRVLRRRSWRPTFVVTLSILLLLAVAVALEGRIRSVLAGVSIAGIAVVLGQVGIAVRAARAALATLRTAAEKADAVEQRVTEQAKQADQELAQEVVEAEGQAAVLTARLEETLASVAAIESQLQDLTPGSRLYSFIAGRAASADYRSQLGVVSTIRRDFDQLAALMAAWRDAQEKGTQANEAQRPIDRIVLYIDDLDRCEPDQVVAVLQAVNLLVAMDLFIVVVGVDPRWLLRSLRRRYRTLLGPTGSGGDDLSFRESTPQDYLEKIFQVPFVLPGLGADGLGRLLHSLVAGGAASPAAPSMSRAHGTSGDGPRQEEAVAAPLPAGRPRPATLPVEQTSEVAAAVHGSVPPTVTRDVTPDELALLSRMHDLVRTPRSAKRLFNLYRLLRSTRDLRPAARFLGSDGQPGEYQAVAILLGVLTAYPELLGTMLWGRLADGNDEPRALCRSGSADGWRAFVAGLRPRESAAGWANDVTDVIDDVARPAWVDLVDALEALLGPEDHPLVTLDEIGPYRLWGPRVARFSFVLSAFAAAEADPR